MRRLAEEHGLVNSHKPDSQDICFVPDGDYVSFIERYTGYKPVSGEYVFSDGKRAGEHSGIINYTIGQRKGLGVTFGKPVFVTDKDPLSNTVTLGDEAELFRRTLFLRDFNLIIADKLSEPMRVTANPAIPPRSRAHCFILPKTALSALSLTIPSVPPQRVRRALSMTAILLSAVELLQG